MNVLVDTSVWSLALRRRAQNLSPAERSLVYELEEVIREGRVRLLGLVRQELLSGVKTSAQFEKLRATLRAFPDEPVHTADYEAAAKTSNDCRARGITASLVDILICAIALERSLLIFTTDPDFRTYARVLPLRFHIPRDLARRTV
jgi:predicted nucleic acid-binding protein